MYTRRLFSHNGRTNKEGVIVAIITDPPYRVISGGKPKHKGQPSGLLSKNDGKIFTHNDLKEEDWFPKIFKTSKKMVDTVIL